MTTPYGRKAWTDYGRSLRKTVPRTSLADWHPYEGRDPVQILIDQGPERVQALLPLRYQRMLVSPFTFYRGAAAVMAADLSHAPDTHLRVQLAGDAHLSNFGAYASPDRDLVFDVNDFDETLPGPFEWDLKRLIASFAVACRDRGMGPAERRKVLTDVTATYRNAMAEFAQETRLQVWYARLDLSKIQAQWGDKVPESTRARLAKVVAKAQRKTSERALQQMTETVDGHLQFISNPPLLVPLNEMMPKDEETRVREILRKGFAGYVRSMPSDRRELFRGYDLVGIAHKVVGVGSVGTRCWVALFNVEGDDSDPLVLQMKQAMASVLEPYAGRSKTRSHGQRVVEGQRLMQAATDIFLGWTSVDGIDGVRRDFYVRQLWDWKGSADLATMHPSTYPIYAQICGWTLARAHARSGNRYALTGYLGTGPTMDEALADWAEAYADQNEADHAALQAAADSGRITVADDDTNK